MTGRRITTTKQLPATTYIVISAVGFLVSIFCIYYYIHFVQGTVTEQVSQKIFYLVLILFGISASAMIFGAMNSYGALQGKKFDTKFQFTGPVVGVILTVFGGFLLPHALQPQAISVRVVNEHNSPVTDGKVVLYLPHYTREQLIDDKGMAVFADLTEEDLKGKIRFDVSSDGYARLSFDTMLRGFGTLQLALAQARIIHISGKITRADEAPIPDVEVTVDGTRFYGRTVSNGDFSIDLYDYLIGDQVKLVTSHKDYVDKTKELAITRQNMDRIDFVLQPLQ